MTAPNFFGSAVATEKDDGVVPQGPPIVARGQPSKYELGVAYWAPYEILNDGFALHGRRCARALQQTGCPVHLRSVSMRMYDVDLAMRMSIADMLDASLKSYSVQVHQVVPSPGVLFALTSAPHRFLTPEEAQQVNDLRVVSLVFERWPIPKAEVDCLRRVAQVWVACKMNARVLAESGVDASKIRVVPIPFFPDDPHLVLAGRKRLPGRPPVLYHIGKWEPRKAQDKIIGAFMLAFRPGEAVLVIKTSKFSPNYENYPRSAGDCITSWLADERVRANGWSEANFGDRPVQQSLFVVANQVSEAQLLALHRSGDIYVTLSRGEGFDMPAMDSKLAGNFLLYTPSGGPQDFAAPSDFRVESAGDVACDPFYGWEGGRYLDFRIEDAVAAMRLAAERALAGETGMQPDLEPFRAATVGKRMLENLEQIVRPYGGRVF